MAHLDNTWKLEDAKAHFSELVRRARANGPQTVTVRGKDAVVVVAAEQAPRAPAAGSLVEFLRDSPLGLVAVDREEDRGRELEL